MWGKSSTPATPVATPPASEPAVRQFTGTNMRALLAEVRQVFGRDAVILKQESRDGRICITACSERQLVAMTPPDDAFGIGPIREAAETSGFANDPIPGPERERRPGRALADRISAIDLPETNPVRRGWLGRGGRRNRSPQVDTDLLLALHYHADFVTQLVDDPQGEDTAESVACALVDERGARTIDETSGTLLPGVYRFVGPAGHGKTSLIAKLATAFVLAQGRDGVVLASTDQHRLGGTLKLERLAQLLDVPFHVIETKDIPTLMRSRPRLLLIDTDGRESPGERSRQAPVDILVLSAVAQPAQLTRALEQAGQDSVVALTQLDLADTLGEPLSVLATATDTLRPLEWLVFGESIDDSHVGADVANVSQWALRGIDRLQGVDRSGMRTNFS